VNLYGTAVDEHGKPGTEHRRQGRCPRSSDLRFQQIVGGCELQIMGEIVDVSDERHLNGALTQPDVQIAEGDRVGLDRERQRGAEDCDQPGNPPGFRHSGQC
jgi:hypothetical protein